MRLYPGCYPGLGASGPSARVGQGISGINCGLVSSLLLVNEIIGDVAIAHEIQAGALIVELDTGLAAIEEIKSQSWRYFQAL